MSKWYTGGTVHYELSDSADLLEIVITLPNSSVEKMIRVRSSTANFKRLKQFSEMIGLLLLELNNENTN